MMDALQTALFFALIAAFVAAAGIVIVARRGGESPAYANLFSLAAAGALCSTVFLHILPEAFSLSQMAPVWLMAGFFSGLILDYIVDTLFPGDDRQGMAKKAILPILAIALHSFTDGIIYAVTFITSLSIGISTAFGLILHKLPEGIIAFAILRRNQVSLRMSLVLAIMATAVTTPLGTLLSGPFISENNDAWVGYLFAGSGGILLFVATGPLIAPLRNVRAGPGIAALFVGLVVTSILILLPIGGSHAHGHVHASATNTNQHEHTRHIMHTQTEPETGLSWQNPDSETDR